MHVDRTRSRPALPASATTASKSNARVPCSDGVPSS